MARPDHPKPTQLERDLADLKLLEIAKSYREVLDEAARKGGTTKKNQKQSIHRSLPQGRFRLFVAPTYFASP